MNTSRRKLLRKDLPFIGLEASLTQRTPTPNNIVADKEDLYAENMRLKQTIHDLQRQLNKTKVRLASRDDEWSKKVRIFEKCTNLKQVQSILGQEMEILRRKNHELLNDADALKLQLTEVHKNTRVGHLLHMESQIASLKEDNERLRFQIKMMCKHNGAEDQEFQKSFQYEALSQMAAIRIQKLTKKNQEYNRQLSSLKQENKKLRAKLYQFESELDQLNALRMQNKENSLTNNVISEETSDYCHKLKEKLEEAERKIKDLENTRKENAQNNEFIVKKCINKTDINLNKSKNQLVLPTSRELTLSRLECLENSPAPLRKIKKSPIKLDIDNVMNIGKRILKHFEQNGLTIDEFRKLVSQCEENTLNLEEIIVLLSESPFSLQNEYESILLGRYLTQTQIQAPSVWIQFKKSISSSIFWKDFSNFLERCETQEHQQLQSKMTKAKRFAILNEPLIRSITAERKQKSQNKVYAVSQYPIRELLQALDDLDASGRYSAAIQKIRQMSQPNQIVSWQQFIDYFKIRFEDNEMKLL